MRSLAALSGPAIRNPGDARASRSKFTKRSSAPFTPARLIKHADVQGRNLHRAVEHRILAGTLITAAISR